MDQTSTRPSGQGEELTQEAGCQQISVAMETSGDPNVTSLLLPALSWQQLSGNLHSPEVTTTWGLQGPLQPARIGQPGQVLLL